MRAVALAVALSLSSTACFPTNPRARTIAKLSEGAVLVGGVVMEAFTNTGADCTVSMPGMPDSGCKDSASFYGDLGVILILAGLVGFIATISTTPDEDAKKPLQEIKQVPTTPTPAPIAPPPMAPEPAPPPAAAPMPAAAGSAT